MTRRADVQLWGGPQDGLKSQVEISQFSGPPSIVDVPERPSMRPLLLSSTEIDPDLLDIPTRRYRLDLDYTGQELLYRVERPLHV